MCELSYTKIKGCKTLIDSQTESLVDSPTIMEEQDGNSEEEIRLQILKRRDFFSTVMDNVRNNFLTQ